MLIVNVTKNLMQRCAAKFAKSEDGAVSVDGVVLTASIVGVAAVAANTVEDSVTALGESIEQGLVDTEVDNGN